MHRATWPTLDEIPGGGAPLVAAVAVPALAAVRRAKSEQKRSLLWPIERVTVTDTPERLAALRLSQDDLVAAGTIASIEYVELVGQGVATYEVSLGEHEP